MFSDIQSALDDLRAGKVVIVSDDESRENEGDFVAIAEFVTPEAVNFMAKEGRGLICTPVDQELANKLSLSPMTEKNTDSHGTAFTISIDHQDTTTGISAYERAHTIRRMLADEANASEFNRPGHVFPLVAKNGGVLKRQGHTEAAVDLARLAGAKPAGVICEIMSDDGRMAQRPELEKISREFGLKMITVKQLVEYRLRHEALIQREAEIQLPTQYGTFRAIGYSSVLDGKEHIAILKGQWSEEEGVMTRIHSECLTGDVFSSHRCDCGEQLERTLALIEQEGKGILLYMRQEGRGIGLINKLKAYELQEQGFDTVEANEKMGFPDDARDYGISAQILADLGVGIVNLLTNNPRKVEGLTRYGIDVADRLPLELPPQEANKHYLTVKKEKLGHLLSI